MPEINWEALEHNETWAKEIVPALEERLQDLYRDMLTAEDPVRWNFLRGQAKAIYDLIGRPEMDRLMREHAERALGTESAPPEHEEPTQDERRRDRRSAWSRIWERDRNRL